MTEPRRAAPVPKRGVSVCANCDLDVYAIADGIWAHAATGLSECPVADIEKELAEKIGFRLANAHGENTPLVTEALIEGKWRYVRHAGEPESTLWAALLAVAGERAKLEHELQYIDATLARRPALDLPTRAENIEKAINVAAKCDAAERRASTEAAANMKLRGDLESLRVKLEELIRQRDFEWRERKAEAERARGLEAQQKLDALSIEAFKVELGQERGKVVALEAQLETLRVYVQGIVDYDHAKHCSGEHHCANCINGRAALSQLPTPSAEP